MFTTKLADGCDVEHHDGAVVELRLEPAALEFLGLGFDFACADGEGVEFGFAGELIPHAPEFCGVGDLCGCLGSELFGVADFEGVDVGEGAGDEDFGEGFHICDFCG